MIKLSFGHTPKPKPAQKRPKPMSEQMESHVSCKLVINGSMLYVNNRTKGCSIFDCMGGVASTLK